MSGVIIFGMPSRKTGKRSERLRVSPNFALRFSQDGKPHATKQVEPYIEYELTERYRVLHSLFAKRGGATVDDVIGDYFRCPPPGNPAARPICKLSRAGSAPLSRPSPNARLRCANAPNCSGVPAIGSAPIGLRPRDCR